MIDTGVDRRLYQVRAWGQGWKIGGRWNWRQKEIPHSDVKGLVVPPSATRLEIAAKYRGNPSTDGVAHRKTSEKRKTKNDVKGPSADSTLHITGCVMES